MDTLKGQIAYNNDGMRASYRASNHSFNLLARNGVRIEGNTVTRTVSRCSKSIAVMRRGKHRAVIVS